MSMGESRKFSDLYLFAYTSKSTMALYYMAFVLLYLFLGKVSIATDIALDFSMAIQMLIASMLIGFGQGLIVPVERLNSRRCAVWMAWSTFITVGCVLALKWFDGFPAWCSIVFCAFMTFGFAALLLGLLFDSRRETRKLNEQLKVYQNNLRSK